MELVFKKKTCILIDDIVFTEEGFIIEIKKMVEEVLNKKSDIRIYVDSSINSKVDELKRSENSRNAYLLDGILDILLQNKMLQLINTNSYLDTSEFERIIENEKDASLYVITQREMVYNVVKDLLQNYPDLVICMYKSHKFEKWTEKQKNLDAFFLDNDENYIHKFDTNNLDYVYSPKYGYLKLDTGSQITGGEGSVYRTYNNMMAKIYNKNSITYINYKKLLEMINMNVYNQFICWPRDLLYVDGLFVGYLMDEIKNAKTLLNLRINNFSTMNHLERFKLCYNFLKNVNYLHEKGILIGDLKPDNILVKSPEEVYFIDCGCYQISDYCCPVCHPEYTKRVFKNDEIKKQLRTEEDEYYPINKMAFEILIKKDHTYDPDNIEVENQDKSKFSYPLDISQYNRETEDAMIWKALTPTMREYFYYYFKQGKITHLDEWVNELKMFIDKAEGGKQ